MKRSGFRGIHERAFAHRLKRSEYTGSVKNEIVTEMWYMLRFEDAQCFIDDDEKWIEHKIKQGQTLLNSWIKLITYEFKNTITGEIRRCWSASLRPYVQGYGCDGTTDLNIHTIANRLAEQHGIVYPALLIRAYPNDFCDTDDFSWLQDDVVLAETSIPATIDADLALKDLQEINNYTLAEEFGIELYDIGVITTDWSNIRKTQELEKKKIERDVLDWLEENGLLT